MGSLKTIFLPVLIWDVLDFIQFENECVTFNNNVIYYQKWLHSTVPILLFRIDYGLCSLRKKNPEKNMDDRQIKMIKVLSNKISHK